jgi:ubiquitin carboxyl-terminal hydrolase 9/24
MLAIQLKRFDYDWERDIAVKSNEYFEFPREIDMEPYTVKGIARLEQQQQQHSQKQTDQTKIDENILNYENDSEDELDKVYSNKYKLFGVVVHSGQANGGHYYSFIRNRVEQDTANENDEQNWFKFDDGDVSEFKMDDDEMRSQCYGGDYTGEVYDNVMKRMSLKKQKRWWNAYILFYERLKQTPSWSSSPNSTFLAEKNKETESNTEAKAVQQEVLKMPHFVMKSVQKKNIKFLHHRLHFSSEYFQFIKKLVQTNLNLCQSENNLNVIYSFNFRIEKKNSFFPNIIFVFKERRNRRLV